MFIPKKHLVIVLVKRSIIVGLTKYHVIKTPFARPIKETRNGFGNTLTTYTVA